MCMEVGCLCLAMFSIRLASSDVGTLLLPSTGDLLDLPDSFHVEFPHAI